ncbi:hypothetical protein, variant [Aphanomyces astaci]|uniref:AAA+ ATPase domain-containing protein n=1 Tax=Aphanomyces astaci TaxID=112090 RepID=W4HBE8_APHAT|nr:hypothetical protein, variant [Aphanomyces astaci]ETV88569.1 hypothetical protein, variant [Aphanomyces astaci]|eukprot:XP_009820969.1 hypothetical protein, variant [Aphanomyces astaci]
MEILLVVPRVALPHRHDGHEDFRTMIYMEDDHLLSDLHEGSIASIHGGLMDVSEPLVYGQVLSLQHLPRSMQDIVATFAVATERRPVALGSFGLAVSLQLSHISSTMARLSVDQRDNAAFNCYVVALRASVVTIPIATSVTLHIPSLQDAPAASKITRAMERIGPQLLSGSLAWHGRVLPITWRHTLELAHVCIDDDASRPRVSIIDATTAIAITITSPRVHLSAAQHPRPTPSFLIDSIFTHVSTHMAGYITDLHRIVSTIVHSLYPPAAMPLTLPVGMVLSGAPGVGKSHLVRLLHASFRAFPSRLHCVTVSAPDLFHTQVGRSEAHLAGVFSALKASTVPTLVCIEDLDAIASMSSTVALDQSLLGVLVACLDQASKQPSSRVFVIGTTNRLDAIDASVRRRLLHHVALRPPSEADRVSMLELMCRQCRPPLPSPGMLADVAGRTSGFVGADLLHLVREATLHSIHVAKHPGVLHDMAAWEHALSLVRPSSVVQHLPQTSSHLLAPLVGLDDVWAALDVALLQPLRDSSAFRRMGMLPPKGILITGPSGVGKSHLLAVLGAKAQQRATCLSVKCTDLVTKVVGGTEAALAALFATARAAAPCVLLFDQIESLAPVRGFDSTTEQTFDRVLSTLLTEMDGFGTNGKCSV